MTVTVSFAVPYNLGRSEIGDWLLVEPLVVPLVVLLVVPLVVPLVVLLAELLCPPFFSKSFLPKLLSIDTLVNLTH
jgi:hypothetical protein